MYNLWKENGKPRALPSGLLQWNPPGPVTLKAPKPLHHPQGQKRAGSSYFCFPVLRWILSTVFWGSKDLETLSQILKMGHESALAEKVLQP